MYQFIKLFTYSFIYLLIHLFSGLAIKCYTGTKIINSPFSPNLSYVAEECAPDVNACVTAEFTTKQTFGVFSITVQIISGGCYIAHPAHPVLCASYCNTLKSAFSYISNCKVSNIRINYF